MNKLLIKINIISIIIPIQYTNATYRRNVLIGQQRADVKQDCVASSAHAHKRTQLWNWWQKRQMMMMMLRGPNDSRYETWCIGKHRDQQPICVVFITELLWWIFSRFIVEIKMLYLADQTCFMGFAQQPQHHIMR